MASMPRLPVVLMVGTDDRLKVNLAQQWRDEFAANEKSWALVVNTAQPAEQATRIAGCLCCTGKVTLLSKLTQLLRHNRQHAQRQGQQNQLFAGIFLVANANAELFATLDHLRQPLLQNLIRVARVVYLSEGERTYQATAAINSDIVIAESLHPAMEATLRDFEAQHFIRRCFSKPPSHSELEIGVDDFIGESESAIGNLFRWPSDTIFHRAQLEIIFNNLLPVAGPFEALFRTKRDWYCWNGTDKSLTQRVALFRRESYLSIGRELPPHLIGPLLRSINEQSLA